MAQMNTPRCPVLDPDVFNVATYQLTTFIMAVLIPFSGRLEQVLFQCLNIL